MGLWLSILSTERLFSFKVTKEKTFASFSWRWVIGCFMYNLDIASKIVFKDNVNYLLLRLKKKKLCEWGKSVNWERNTVSVLTLKAAEPFLVYLVIRMTWPFLYLHSQFWGTSRCVSVCWIANGKRHEEQCCNRLLTLIVLSSGLHVFLGLKSCIPESDSVTFVLQVGIVKEEQLKVHGF